LELLFNHTPDYQEPTKYGAVSSSCHSYSFDTPYTTPPFLVTIIYEEQQRINAREIVFICLLLSAYIHFIVTFFRELRKSEKKKSLRITEGAFQQIE